jgi:hypothetical protein
MKKAPRGSEGAAGSNFGILGRSTGVFIVDPEIAYRIFDPAITKKDLDITKVDFAGYPRAT